MPKKVYFGPNLDVFGPKILIFTGVCISFGTNITEKPPRQLVCVVLVGRALDQMGQKCQYLAKISVLRGWSKIFGTLISGNL